MLLLPLWGKSRSSPKLADLCMPSLAQPVTGVEVAMGLASSWTELDFSHFGFFFSVSFLLKVAKNPLEISFPGFLC